MSNASDYVFVLTITDTDGNQTTEEYGSRLLTLKRGTDALSADPSLMVTIEARYVASEKFKSIQNEFFTKLCRSGISDEALSELIGSLTYNEYITWKAGK